VDVARTALRAGAQEVQLYCLEPRDEMPAWEKDVEEAIDEGIVINPDLSPSKITYKKGHVTGIEFTHCICVFDDEGCFNPTCDLDDTRFVDADNVIISIGQAADMSFLDADSKLERELWGALVVDTNTLATNVPGVFAGGDFTTGPTFVIRAIASGRRAAIAIDKYLGGDNPADVPPLPSTNTWAVTRVACISRMKSPPGIRAPNWRLKKKVWKTNPGSTSSSRMPKNG